MSGGYTIRNLRDVDDAAARFGFSDTQESRFPAGDLGAAQTGLAYHVLKPGRRQSFGHRHEEAEEIAVVIGGSGRVRLGDDVRELGPLDAIRIAPEVPRSFEGGPGGMALLVFGPHHEGDGELLPDFWTD